MRKAWLAGLLPWIASAALLGSASTAPAQVAEPTYQFNLRAQGVGGALRLFGEVTHQQIIFAEVDGCAPAGWPACWLSRFPLPRLAHRAAGQ